MARNILVLGVHTQERDVFGGILDMDRIRRDEAGKVLVAAVNTALAEKITSGHLFGSAEVDSIACTGNDAYEQMPFVGEIVDTVCLYID